MSNARDRVRSCTDRDSAVAHSLANPRGYAALHDLGTDPRIRYRARITNSNPTLAGGG